MRIINWDTTEKGSKYRRLSTYLLLLLALSLVIFVTIKATISSFTHDESYSYLRYVGQSIIQIFSYDTPFTNNHILNTVFMKYSEMLFGSSEIALRTPNIVSLIIYLYFTYLLLKDRSFTIILPVFILMSFSPYLLDFFGLARGYGISIGFMIFSLYYLLRFFETDKQKDLVLFNLGALLAALANFALLDFWLAAIVAFNFVLFLNSRILNKRTSFKEFLFKYNTINIVFILLGSVLLYEPLRKIMQLSIIDFGGKSGFVHNTIGTLIIKIFYKIPVGSGTWLGMKIFVLLIVGFVFIVIAKNVLNKNTSFMQQFKPLIISNLILILITIITIVQHLLFQMDYLMGRFALFLFPLFILNIGYTLEYFLQKGYKYVSYSIFAILVILTLVNFSININLKSYLDWQYDADNKNAVEELMSVYNKDDSNRIDIKLGVNWLFEPGFNFYRKTWEIDWLLEVDRVGVEKSDDYSYIFVEELNEKGLKGTIIFSSEACNTLLLKNEMK